MGKHRIIAETGAGQHGVATATVCALLGMECVVYMGEEDMRRQELNVFRMRLLGAEVRGVSSGSKTLKDAINEAMRDWVTNVRTTHYLLGCVLGAHPYPMMVRDFHRVIGRRSAPPDSGEGRPPARRRSSPVSAAARNAIGAFYEFMRDPEVRLIGVEAGGRGTRSASTPRASSGGAPGVLQGTYSYVLQDEHGQIALDAFRLRRTRLRLRRSRARGAARLRPRRLHLAPPTQQALDATVKLARTEGIMPALESAHAVAEVHPARAHAVAP